MADGLSLVLWSLAEYFNYFSVTLIILCSGLMTAFIIRLNGDHWGRYHNEVHTTGSSLAQQKDVTAFSNPFFLRLSSTITSNLSDGVWLEVSCLIPCEIRVYWGAIISPVHAALLKPGTDFLQDLLSDNLLTQDSLAIDLHSVQTAGKQSIHLVVPDEVTENRLGPPPRQRYPCVVVMSSTESLNDTEHTTVVGVMTVIHLKDSQCPMETHIVAQFAKMAGHAVYNLQPLFLASELDDHSDASPDQQEDNQESCQTSRRMEDISSTQATPTSQPLPSDNTDSSRDDSKLDQQMSENTSDTSAGNTSNTSSCHHRFPSSGDYCEERSDNRDSIHDSFSYQRQNSDRSLPECIVCQNQTLNCALLPCRHTCVCRMCFHKLDRCPMCRSHIESFFTLTDSDEEEFEPTSPPLEPIPMDLLSRFERFNQRLNNYFGFD